MRRYKNVSKTLLHVDCITHTVHLKPGEAACLPITRDIRFYLKTRQLISLREEKKQVRRKKKRKPQKRRRTASFKKKLEEKEEKEKLTKMETE